MIKISFKKVAEAHCRILKVVIEDYATSFAPQLKDTSDTGPYMEAILTTDIAAKVYLVLRSKIEANKAEHTFSLKVSEAVVLHDACNHAMEHGRDDVYVFNAIMKCRDSIDEQLKAILPKFKNPILLLN